jgi:hypothetical protein
VRCRRFDQAEVVRRYLIESEGVTAIARSLGTRPSYVLRLLLARRVSQRHQPSHSEWARTRRAERQIPTHSARTRRPNRR